MADDVLATNQAFYDAHEQRDIAAMRRTDAGWRMILHHGSPVMTR